MKSPIIIFSDSPVATTGFARVVEKLVNVIIAMGEVPIVVGNKANCEPVSNKYVLIHPRFLGDEQGINTLEAVLKKTKAKIVISVEDAWKQYKLVDLKEKYGFYFIGYVPIEGIPYPRKTIMSRNPNTYLDTSIVHDAMDKIVCYTKFGKDAMAKMLEQAGIYKDISQVYHGVDTSFFLPVPKREAKKLIGIPENIILFTSIKTNNPRSGFELLLDAWKIYIEKAIKTNPDIANRSRLYIHTNCNNGAYNIKDMLIQRDIDDGYVIYE